MSSIVAEILSSRGKAEVEDLSLKIEDLASRITDFKLDAKKVLEGRYLQFKLQLVDNLNLANRLSSLSKQMDELHSRIEKETKADLQNSTSELKSLSSNLQEMNLKLNVMKHLVEIDVKLNHVDQELSNSNYHKVAEILCDVSNGLRSVKGSDECEPLLLKALKERAVYKSEAFLYETCNIWKESVICEKDPDSKVLSYTIKMNNYNTAAFTELARALHMYGDLTRLVHLLANRIFDYIIVTLMERSCQLKSSLSSENIFFLLTVESNVRPSPTIVIQQLQKLFKFLEESLNILVEPGLTLIHLIGKKIATQFCDLYVNKILKDSMPSNNNEREAYNLIVEQTIDLQKYLVEIGFLQSADGSIMQYAMNVDTHFVNKMCEMKLNKARAIMRKDLHDTTEMKPKFPQVAALAAQVDDETAGQSENFSSLSSNTLQFPQCLISKSVIELMELIYEILQEAGNNSSEMRAVRLFLIARKIIEMYCAITPTYHKKFLDTLPQQAALFHNNCMYLAHQLLILASEFSSLLAPVLPAQSFTFVDQTTKLRKTGAQVFLSQMQTQRAQLLEILRDSGLSNLGEKDRLPPNTEKSIRQCLRQLELLQKVWQVALPSHVYNKAIGTLLNTFVEELILRVSTTDDIPAETATDLVTVFTTVLDRAPRVLLEAGEVHQYVKSWRAFDELVQLLGANLQAIDDRWADGKGPLAHEFSAERVKKLVRALFQNTERRAALLAKIK